MQLAACYIVRDGAAELDNSIQSLRHAVDELVVVDTGSKDATVEVARSYRAKIFHFTWEDHFAKARNFALEHVESPWVIFLDSDEYFRHPKHVRPAILEQIQTHPDLDAIMLILHNIDINNPQIALPSGSCLRIFRNSPEIRYFRRIHEMLRKKDGLLRITYGDDRLSLNHTGYSVERNTEKMKRNLKLLKKNIDEYGNSSFDEYNLSVCYFELNDYPSALRHALAALSSDLEMVGGQSSLYHVAIESMRQLGASPSDMLPLIQRALHQYPDLPEFYAEQGSVFYAMGQQERARVLFEKALYLYEQSKINPQQISYFTLASAITVCNCLGEIAQTRGDRKKADYWYRHAAELEIR